MRGTSNMRDRLTVTAVLWCLHEAIPGPIDQPCHLIFHAGVPRGGNDIWAERQQCGGATISLLGIVRERLDWVRPNAKHDRSDERDLTQCRRGNRGRKRRDRTEQAGLGAMMGWRCVRAIGTYEAAFETPRLSPSIYPTNGVIPLMSIPTNSEGPEGEEAHRPLEPLRPGD